MKLLRSLKIKRDHKNLLNLFKWLQHDSISEKKSYQINKTTLFLTLSFIVLWSSQSIAQSYIQARFGYVSSQYSTIDKNFSERDEHDFLGGAMFDIELGKEFGKKRITFLLGGRIQYVQERLEGIYTEHQWNSSAKITVHAPAILLTGGVRIKTIGKLSALFQASIGSKYILWYQDGEHKESFWSLYLPLNIGVEYKLRNKLNLISGFSFRPPVYTNQKNKYFLGIRKEF
mgnify:CR=1 FL=1